MDLWGVTVAPPRLSRLQEGGGEAMVSILGQAGDLDETHSAFEQELLHHAPSPSALQPPNLVRHPYSKPKAASALSSTFSMFLRIHTTWLL